MSDTVCLQNIQDNGEAVMDVLERATPDIIKHYLATLTPKERVRLFHTV